jgi:DNA-binding Lrp family transcriptional regulator
MPKSSRTKILEDERRVLLELKKNSNESIGKIAENCNFSRQKAWRIIKRLEKNKVIWGYHAIINNKETYMKEFVLLVKLKRLPINNSLEKQIKDGKVDELASEMGVIIENYLWLHGTYDGIIYFSAEDIKKAKKFQMNFLDLYQDNILESQLLEQIVTIKKGGFTNPEIKNEKSLIDVY